MSVNSKLAKRWNGSSWDIVKMVPQMEAVARRALSDIGQFVTWLNTNNVKGVIGEVGWANDHVQAGEGALWNGAADLYLSYVDSCRAPGGLDYLCWVGSSDWNSNPSNGNLPYYALAVYYTDATKGDTLKYAGTQAAIAEKHYALGGPSRGVNNSSAIFSAEPGVDGVAVAVHPSGFFNSSNSGIVGTDYWYPSVGDLTFLAGRGVKAVCMRFRWERLQPNLGQALDSTALSEITSVLDNAQANGIKIILCPHNGMGYILGTSPTSYDTYPISQAGTVTIADFVDLWTRVSSAIGDHPALHGYDFCNEPAFPSCGIPSGSNLLSNGSFGSGISGWSAKGPSTIAYASTVGHSSPGCVKITSTGGASPAATTGYIFSVTPGQQYHFEAWYLAASNSQRENASMSLDFQDAQGRYLGSIFANAVKDSGLQWRFTSGAGAVPASAATMAVNVYTQTGVNGETHYVDDIMLRTCTSAMSATQLWNTASQQVVTALRAQGDAAEYWVESSINTSPVGFINYNATPWITDPADNTRYSVHHYWDNADGGGGAYTDTFAAEESYDQTAGY